MKFRQVTSITTSMQSLINNVCARKKGCLEEKGRQYQSSFCLVTNKTNNVLIFESTYGRICATLGFFCTALCE